MRQGRYRAAVAVLVVAGAVAGGGGSALGIEVGVQAPTVPSAPDLQPPTELPPVPSPPSTPSVPSTSSPPSTPSVPSTPAVPSTPSVPSAPSAPSAPSTSSAPSDPSVPVPDSGSASVPGAGSGAGNGSGSVGAGGSASPGVAAAAAPRAEARRRSAARHHAAARRQRYERRLRSRVRRDRGCLSSIPSSARELLSLRAGIGGPPRSRAEAASELGISRRGAARLEREGLRALHVACGSARGGRPPARVSTLATGAPDLQPAAYLPVSDAPALRPAVALGDEGDRKRGSGDVKGATASSSPGAGTRPPVQAAVRVADGAASPALPIATGAVLALVAALALVAFLRRRGDDGWEAASPAPAAALPTAASPAPAPARHAASTAAVTAAAPAAASPAPAATSPAASTAVAPVAAAPPSAPAAIRAPAPVVKRMRPRDPRRLALELKRRHGR